MPEEKDPQAEARRMIEEGRARQAEAVRLQEEMDQARPTPTQEENDMAKLGVLDPDDKEESNAPEEGIRGEAAAPQPAGIRQAVQAPGEEEGEEGKRGRSRSASYNTRDAKAE